METISITQFISVIIPLTGGALIAFYVLFNRNTELKAEQVKLKEQIDNLRTSNEYLEETLQTLTVQRNKDLLDFTNILAGINTTLAKVETTLGHFENTIKEIKNVIEDMRS